MICQHCGSDTPAPAVSCTVCNTPIDTPGDQESEAPTLLPPTGPAAADEVEAPTAVRASGKPSSEAPTMQPPSGSDEDEALTGVRTGALPSSSRTDARTGPLEVGEAFGNRYQIIELLGEGGMGAVYKAWDRILSVVVAIKVIRPEVLAHPVVARDLERRFKRELLLARMVTHKNVVRIHDLGEINGIKYITMSFVEGIDLSAILKGEGKLPVPRALKIARRIVSGLKAAHEVDVVHRDLKPSNIMIDVEDEPLIMDFGVARSASTRSREPEAAEPPSDPQPLPQVEYQPGVTMPGAVVGTYDYMAPEQAMGEEVDQRADLYAFGLILYDLLVGPDRRESRSKQTAERAEHTEQASLSARKLDPEIPEALDRIVLRCQERDPAARYQTAAEIEADLEKLDETGEPLPPAWRISRLQIVGAALLAILAVAGTWWFTRTPPPPIEPDPVSVLIADFQNRTNDSTLDGVLEPMLKIALEEAGFISAYDRLEIRRTLGVRPPETLDETSARELAVNQGVGVVLSGSLDRQAGGYGLSMKALEAVTGNPITTVEDRTSSRDQVLAMATELANEVREALGDDLSDSVRRFAMETLSATSLEVVGEYAGAMESLSRGGYEDALQRFSNAVSLDPDFGLAYAGMAAVSRNLGRQEDAEKYLNQAVSHLDSMTERERYRTRALFYAVTGDYKACVTEYGDLIARYAGDTASRNNLALCATFLRDWPTALEEMTQLIEMVPARDLYRENLATYLSYAGDFQAGEQAALKESGVWGLLALAFAQAGQGRLPEAMATYQAMGEIDAIGASYMASGLADLAMYEGRFAEASRLLREGATADLTNEEPGRAARKLALLAQAQVSGGEIGPAIATAQEVLASSQDMRTRFLAARVLVEAGEVAGARGFAEELASEVQAEAQAYAKIIEGEAALKDGNPREAVTLLTEANDLLDTWLGHFDLGRAYMESGAYLRAEGEFDRCLTRRGEAMSLFLDEEPTYGYFPAVYYYQGRVREGLNNAGSTESYRRYLEIRGNAGEDPLLPEIRRRSGGSN